MTDKKQHPLERISGMTKTVTLPGSGAEVVIRRLDMEVLTQDFVLSTMKSKDLMTVASRFAGEANEAMGADAALNDAIDHVEVMKAIRAGLLREGVIRPTIDELRTEVYGGRAESSDLGMGPDYSYLVKAVEEFQADGAGESGEKAAAAFPEEVREPAARTGE